MTAALAAGAESPQCGGFGPAFLAAVNSERSAAQVPPLTLSPELCRAAQARAEEIGAAGSLNRGAISGQKLIDRVARYGYRASALSQPVVQAPGDPAAVVAEWRRMSASAFKDVRNPRYRDFGVGAAWLDGVPVYVLLLGLSGAEEFAGRTRSLRDPERVRADLLAAVNRERKARKLPPLRSDPRLGAAAQRHAEDMLARGYHGHRGTDGTLAMQRARREGYDARGVGENIAKGQGSVEEVMKGWMRSREHRKNILEPSFVDAGFGLAVGKPSEGDEVLWVQVFGRPQGS